MLKLLANLNAVANPLPIALGDLPGDQPIFTCEPRPGCLVSLSLGVGGLVIHRGDDGVVIPSGELVALAEKFAPALKEGLRLVVNSSAPEFSGESEEQEIERRARAADAARLARDPKFAEDMARLGLTAPPSTA